MGGGRSKGGDMHVRACLGNGQRCVVWGNGIVRAQLNERSQVGTAEGCETYTTEGGLPSSL